MNKDKQITLRINSQLWQSAKNKASQLTVPAAELVTECLRLACQDRLDNLLFSPAHDKSKSDLSKNDNDLLDKLVTDKVNQWLTKNQNKFTLIENQLSAIKVRLGALDANLTTNSKILAEHSQAIQQIEVIKQQITRLETQLDTNTSNQYDQAELEKMKVPDLRKISVSLGYKNVYKPKKWSKEECIEAITNQKGKPKSKK
jgi:hypothetical protein